MMLNMEFNFIVNPLMGRKFKNPIIEYSADYSEYSNSNEYSADYSDYSFLIFFNQQCRNAIHSIW